jgi:hypothetical protein
LHPFREIIRMITKAGSASLASIMIIQPTLTSVAKRNLAAAVRRQAYGKEKL